MLEGMCEMLPYYLYCRLYSHFEEEDGEERAKSTVARFHKSILIEEGVNRSYLVHRNGVLQD